ncbi:MAG: radical SAM protein [Candidatus Coatesbacteria bacterium]|nr:MAG: radical SAM protein [Candidatus Coatesbacteria bacterium]
MAPKPNILAVYPEVAESKIFDLMPPLGTLWIAAVLREAGYPVRFVDEQVEDVDVGALAEELEPALTLIGGTSHSRFEAFDRAAQVKEAYPPTTVVYGGPHASFTADDTLNNIEDVDIIVHGEGEFTSLELARWKEAGGNAEKLAEIKGIAYRSDGRVVSTGWRPFNDDLDALPEPARDLVPMDRYAMELEYLGLPATSVVTARGCPVACSFCSASKMYGRSYATRSLARVVDEVEGLVEKYSIEGLKIFDSTFTLNKKHFLGFCDELERRGLAIPWECEVRVGTVDRSLLERMREAGCYYIDLGVESGDQSVLAEMGKGITLDDAEELLRWAEDLGIRTKVFFTVGHIGETYAAGKDTLRFIRRNRKRITLVGYGPAIRIYPGTRVEEYARENDLLPAGFRWSAPYENRDNLRLFRPADNVPILLQPQLGVRELRRLRLRYILSRVFSLSFLIFKLKLLLRYRELSRFLKLGLKGLAGRKRKSERSS